MPSILEGIRIISMAEQYPGPYCTSLLGDMGADVILVERPGSGDPARQFPSFFNAVNRNKRSVVLDLKSARGLELCRQLIATADVFVEGFRPGVLERLGLGYQALAASHPRLIYCSISGFGQQSPYRDLAAHDLSYAAMAGMFFNLIPDGNFDGRPGIAVGDLSSGMFAALGILGALFARTHTGIGQHVDVAMLDGLISWMSTNLVMHLEGGPARRLDPSYRVFTCQDGKYISLSIAHENHFWRNLCGLLGWSDLAGLTLPERVDRGDELQARLAHVFLTRPRDQWFALLVKADVPCGPVYDLPEVVADPHVVQHELIQRLTGADGRPVYQVAHPIKYSGTPAALRTAAPTLGAHTAEVLQSIGLDPAEIATLRRDRVID